MENYYKEYGKFIINFEEICSRLSDVIVTIVTKRKRHATIHATQIRILLQGLTAQPILSKFKSIILTSEYTKKEPTKAILNLFCAKFQKVIEHRNFLAHGTFYYGDHLGNPKKFQVQNPKLNNMGYYDNLKIMSLKSLEDLNKGVAAMSEFSHLLGSYIAFYGKGGEHNFLNQMKFIIEQVEVEFKEDNKSIQMSPDWCLGE